MVVNVAFFDKFVDESLLVRLTGCKVIRSELCSSRNIRLRKNSMGIYTYDVMSYRIHVKSISFGKYYELEVDSLEDLLKYLPINYKIIKTNVNIILPKSIETFIKGMYNVIEVNKKAYCFVCPNIEEYKRIYRSRKDKVNFNSYIFLDMLK